MLIAAQAAIANNKIAIRLGDALGWRFFVAFRRERCYAKRKRRIAMNQTLQQLKDRKSVRVFTNQPIPPQTIAAILEAAVNAPTAGNQQLYTIIS